MEVDDQIMMRTNCHWNFEGTTKKLSVTGTRRCPSAVYYVLV